MSDLLRAYLCEGEPLCSGSPTILSVRFRDSLKKKPISLLDPTNNDLLSTYPNNASKNLYIYTDQLGWWFLRAAHESSLLLVP